MMTWERGMLGVMTLAGLMVLGITPLAPAPQEPGTEYVFKLNDANSMVSIELGSAKGQSRETGWLTLFLGEPVGNNWNVHCVLGQGSMVNLDDLDLILWPGVIEAHIYAGNLKMFDMDIWYQDPNIWWVDPNWWPNPNDARDPNDAPNPNNIAPGDPNNPAYNDPNDPNYMRWANLSGGPPVSTGLLNSEILYFWRYYLLYGGNPPEEGADMGWSDPFGPWIVSLSDNAPSPGAPGPVKALLDWAFWVKSSEFPVYGVVHMEATGGKARKLDLTVNHSNWGSVTVAPGPIDPNRCNKYIDGTTVTLTGVPVSGKSFKEWTILDPNYPGDLSHSVTVTNNPLVLVMNANWEVSADFKCGSGVEPFIGLALLALALGVVVRRLT